MVCQYITMQNVFIEGILFLIVEVVLQFFRLAGVHSGGASDKYDGKCQICKFVNM